MKISGSIDEILEKINILKKANIEFEYDSLEKMTKDKYLSLKHISEAFKICKDLENKEIDEYQCREELGRYVYRTEDEKLINKEYNSTRDPKKLLYPTVCYEFNKNELNINFGIIQLIKRSNSE